MNETSVCFDMLSNPTVERSGVMTVLVKTTDHEKTRFTVVCIMLPGRWYTPPHHLQEGKLKKNTKFRR